MSLVVSDQQTSYFARLAVEGAPRLFCVSRELRAWLPWLRSSAEEGTTTLRFVARNVWGKVQDSLKLQGKAKSSFRFWWLIVLLTMIVLPMVVVLSIDCCSRDCLGEPGVPWWLNTALVLLLAIILALSLFHARQLLLMQSDVIGRVFSRLWGRLGFYCFVTAYGNECALSVCALVVQWEWIECWCTQCLFQSIQ